KELPRYIGAESVLATAYVAGIIGALDEKLRIFRDENEMVLLSDTNLILSKAISGQDAPFIYEKSGNRFSHFMLDEFQDTSDFQWQNLSPLIQNAIGSGNYTLIVGDAKQSIYRWRGGNMQLLLNGIREQFKAFQSITSNLRLESNYRSREVVVTFNNRFFSLAPSVMDLSVEPGSLASAYEKTDLEQEWKKGKTGDGYVKINFFESGNESIDVETGEITDSGEWKESACTESLLTLQKLFQAGYEPGDIAFLTRQNSEAKEITSFLLNNGIEKIISPDSMQLHQSPKILFLINLLTFINDPIDNLALAHITYYWQAICNPKENLVLDDIFCESRKTKLQFLPEAYRNRLIEFRKIPLYETVEELTGIFELNNTPEAFLQRFLDVVMEYSAKNPANINDFLEWWEENQEKDNCSVIVPSGENAIRVMSIHKSKGLQFPVVIIPFADWRLGPKPNETIWVSNDQVPFNSAPAHPVQMAKKLELSVFADQYQNEVLLNYIDNLNMLYVAATRAEAQLYVFSKKPKEQKEIKINFTGKLIYYTLYRDSEWASQFTERDSATFELGSFSSPFRKKSVSYKEGQNLTKWISVPWKGRLQMLISKKKISFYDPEPPETLYGTLFHTIAAEITTSTNPLLLVDKYIKSGMADEIIKERLVKDLNYLLLTAGKSGWLDETAEIVNETEILLEDGSILRPDRMVLKGNEAIIIDYKTGVEEKFHAKQLEQYAAVLNRMGYSKIKMVIVYPSLEKIVEVNAA
ncbi:MAG TPA: 3'-5' exonuclease, partial [Bacteroidia bacterium]|nr:3'-5' exonuclease [Bacteroidia bacterium]